MASRWARVWRCRLPPLEQGRCPWLPGPRPGRSRTSRSPAAGSPRRAVVGLAQAVASRALGPAGRRVSGKAGERRLATRRPPGRRCLRAIASQGGALPGVGHCFPAVAMRRRSARAVKRASAGGTPGCRCSAAVSPGQGGGGSVVQLCSGGWRGSFLGRPAARRRCSEGGGVVGQRGFVLAARRSTG